MVLNNFLWPLFTFWKVNFIQFSNQLKVEGNYQPYLIHFRSQRLNVELNGLIRNTNLSSKFLKELRLYRALKKSQATNTSNSMYTALPYYLFPDESMAYLLDYFEYDTNVDLSNPDNFVITDLLPKVGFNFTLLHLV